MAEKTRTKLKIEDLPQAEKELTLDEAEATRGGLLPYMEQDNIFKSTATTNIKDGTSNTIMMGDGSVRTH